jgi:hypothetical protein
MMKQYGNAHLSCIEYGTLLTIVALLRRWSIPGDLASSTDNSYRPEGRSTQQRERLRGFEISNMLRLLSSMSLHIKGRKGATNKERIFPRQSGSVANPSYKWWITGMEV